MLDIADNVIAERLATVANQIAGQHGLSAPNSQTVALVDSGFTSMAMVDLMLAVEAEFDLTIPQSDMTPENFRSISSLSRLIGRL